MGSSDMGTRRAVTPSASVIARVAAVRDAPPLGIALLAASLAAPVPEYVATTIAGVPLWWALPGAAPVAVQLLRLDAAGRASAPFTNPGGYAASVCFQAAVLGASGSFDLGSTPLLTVSLLP